jgi:hypothetical protein
MVSPENKRLNGDNLEMNMHPERALFQAFTVPSKKERYIGLLDSKRGREKIRRALDHFNVQHLDPRFCRKIQSNEHSLADILRILKNLGAPSSCYVLSSDSDLDGREMHLSAALKEIIGRGQGTFVSCLPGRLAYFESEEPHERYICYREGCP